MPLPNFMVRLLAYNSLTSTGNGTLDRVQSGMDGPVSQYQVDHLQFIVLQDVFDPFSL